MVQSCRLFPEQRFDVVTLSAARIFQDEEMRAAEEAAHQTNHTRPRARGARILVTACRVSAMGDACR